MSNKEIKTYKLYELVNFDKRFKGVDKEKQKEILKFKHITAEKLKSYKKSDNGNVRLISTGNLDFYTDVDVKSNEVNFGEVISLPSGGTANLKYHNGYFIDALNILFSSKDTTKYNLKYVYHYLKSRISEIQNNYRGSSIQHPDMTSIIEMSIKVPPLETQNKIVNILDRFTELETELETELDLRNLQYKYYLDTLLDFSTNKMLLKNILGENLLETSNLNVDKFKLGDICNIEKGKNYTKNYIQKNSGIYPVFSSQTSNNGIIGCINSYDYNGQFLTWTTDGIYSGTVFYRDEKFSASNHCGIISVKDPNKINIKFLFYLLKIKMPKIVVSASYMKTLGLNVAKEIILDIPHINIQNCIVNILDKLETYTKDIKTGLPLEIKQRKEQFDYYHKMLLTFDDNPERERERVK